VNLAHAQEVMDSFESDVESGRYKSQFTETIRLISRSKKIFILTNTNQNLFKGDFITLLLDQDKPVVRALVGKVHDGLVGIKILKIYSLSNWKRLGKGVDVQIVKGDDTHLFIEKDKKSDADNSEALSIESEEDLYDTTGIDEEIDMFNKDKRLIKPDNILGVSYSQLKYTDYTKNSSPTLAGGTISISWAYQISDNIWVEGIFANTSLQGVPNKGSTSTVNGITGRVKYTVQLPFYSYFMPYGGFLYQQARNATTNSDPVEAEKEDKLFSALNVKKPVFGVTFLKRLVPGWFFKADLGTDVQSLGVAIEF
jgi:hypothetical protein